VREVVLVQDHSVVLEAEPPGQLGEIRALAGGLTLADELAELLVEQVDLLHVAGVQGQVLGHLGIRDAVQVLELEALLRVLLGLLGPRMLTSHRGAPFCPPIPVYPRSARWVAPSACRPSPLRRSPQCPWMARGAGPTL